MSTARSGRPGLRRRVSVPSPRSGARIAFATAQPASLLGVHAALARLAGAARRHDRRRRRHRPAPGRRAHGPVPALDRRRRGGHRRVVAAGDQRRRRGRGVDVPCRSPVTGRRGRSVRGRRGRDGVEVIAFAGLDRVDLAIPAVRSKALQNNGCLVVPVHGGRARARTPHSSRCSNVRTRKAPAPAAPSSEPHRHREARSTTSSAATYGHGPSGRSRESAWGRS